MPLNAIPQNYFRDREPALERLLRLAASGEPAGHSILLVGPRGIGKSELLKQLHHRLFWADDGTVPFYYRFRRATLKAGNFSSDYFSRCIRQFVSCLVKDPGLAGDMGIPVHRLAAEAPQEYYEHISGLVDDFYGQSDRNDLPDGLLAAISAPRTLAARTGRRVVILLDDFHLAESVYETGPGDTPGVSGIFEESINSRCCPHVITGSPDDALETIFADDSLRGRAQRLRVGPLPAKAAYRLFEETCLRHGSEGVTDDCKPLMKHLGGNPLYITNLARAIGGAGVREVGAAAFVEHYLREVTEGETAAYWSSVIRQGIGEPGLRSLVPGLLARLASTGKPAPGPARLARELGISEDTARSMTDALSRSGMLPEPGRVQADTVMQDFISGAQMLYAGTDGPQSVCEAVRRRRFGHEKLASACFEMVIPSTPESELVAAKALEQVCAGAGLDSGRVQQLVMALIEACINAMEHGVGYDDRVLLRFDAYPERLEVAVESHGSVANPGALLKGSEAMPGLDSERGRGFSLMSRLVDDIRIENIGDRTRVVLVKAIKPVKETR